MKLFYKPFFLIAFFASIASSAQTINKNYFDGELYIKVKTLSSNAIQSNGLVSISTELPFLSKYSTLFGFIQAKKSFYTANSPSLQRIYRLTLKKPEIINTVIEKLKNDSSVEYIEKVPIRQVISTPNDPSTSSQWSLTTIKAFDAWDINAGSANVIVAVVDNAIQSTHVDLQGNMLAGYDVADNDANTNPPNTNFSHGTHVSGIVGAVSNNGIGIASAGNNHVKVLPVKTTPDAGAYNSIYYGYEGITWAADNGAKIISCSWGGAGFVQAEQDVIDYCYSKGIIVVAAAGNDNTSNEGYPAAYNHVISVASTESNDSKSSFSTYGTWVDISAPGRAILSTIPFDSYASYSGTSMATPLVSSALGYIWSCFPALTPAQLESILKNTADNIDAQNPTYLGQLGAGRINLLKAIACPNGGLSSAIISASASPYICLGDSITLSSSTTGAGISYAWLLNGVALGKNTATIKVGAEGNYKLILSNGSCSLLSNSINVAYNHLITPSPSVTNNEGFYCSTITAGNGVKATAIACNFGGPQTFSYAGGTVGYDGYSSSGADPSATVSSLGGTVTNVSVSITWQKIDGGDETTCGTPSGTGTPYNEEVSFKLKSPSGTIITLINGGTYARGTTTSGMVTTVFQDGGATLTNGSLPVSGTFAPNQALSTFLNELPIGTWTLLPQDDGFIDPLCVQSFSITITTSSPNQASTLTWWNAQTNGNLLATGTEYLPNTTAVGTTQVFYAQAKCEGLCPSLRTPVYFTIRQVPYVLAFPYSSTTINDFTSNSLFKDKIILNKTGNIYTLSNQNNTNSLTFNTPPLISPITPCVAGNKYLLAAFGCNSTVTWLDSNGQTGFGTIVQPTVNISYYATCADVLNCPTTPSNAIRFAFNPTNISFEDNFRENSNQKFWANYLESQRIIFTPSNITFKANNSIILKPGFTVSGNSVFRAEIGPCEN